MYVVAKMWPGDLNFYVCVDDEGLLEPGNLLSLDVD